MRQTAGPLLLGMVVLAAGCGDKDAPVTPVAPVTLVAAPTPTPAPTPAPAPTPDPCQPPTCEPPVTNTNPAVRLTLRLYTVIDDGGNWVQNWNDKDEIPVGWKATIDATAKDVANKDTLGQGEIEWFFSDLSLVKVGHEGHSHQRRVTVVYPGGLDCWATLDGVRSNTLRLNFRAK